MDRSQSAQRPRRISWNAGISWSALALSGTLALGGCSAPPAFGEFEADPGPQDTLPSWVTLEAGGDEARYLTTKGTARYYVSRSDTAHCLVIVLEDQDEGWSAGCSDGQAQNGVLMTSSGAGLGGEPGAWASVALVVDGYPGNASPEDGRWESIHENLLVSQTGAT